MSGNIKFACIALETRRKARLGRANTNKFYLTMYVCVYTAMSKYPTQHGHFTVKSSNKKNLKILKGLSEAKGQTAQWS